MVNAGARSDLHCYDFSASLPGFTARRDLKFILGLKRAYWLKILC